MLGRGVVGDITLASSGFGMLLLFRLKLGELAELTDRKVVAMICCMSEVGIAEESQRDDKGVLEEGGVALNLKTTCT